MSEKKEKKNKYQFEISTKHIPLRIVLFVISLVLAIGGIGYGIYAWIEASQAATGWNTYTLSDSEFTDSSYPGYGQNIVLVYYSSSSTNANNVKKLLKSSAKEIYSLIDANSTHEYENHSIGYINAHRGEKISIEKDLYDILMDAKEKTYASDSAYSMFSGLTYQYWQKLAVSNYTSSKKVKDPSINDDKKEELEAITSVCSNLDNFNLKLEEESGSYYATFTISDEVTNLIEKYDLDVNEESFSILDLNSLYYSYYLDYLYHAFNTEGYVLGYFTTYTGEMIFMSNNFTENNNAFIYDYNTSTSEVETCGYYSVSEKCYISQIRSYPAFDDYYEGMCESYIVEDSEFNEYYRNCFYDYRTGYNTQNIMTSFIATSDMESSLADLTYENLNIYNKGALTAYQNIKSDQFAAVTLASTTETIYCNDFDYYSDYSYTNSQGKTEYISYERKDL